jgi:hypothetical protein
MLTPRFSAGGIDPSPGLNATMADTLVYAPLKQAPEPAAQVGGSSSAVGGNAPHFTVIGFLLLLVAMWLIQRVSPALREAGTIVLNIWNFFAIGVTAIASILIAKWVFNRVPIPNLTEAVNAA